MGGGDCGGRGRGQPKLPPWGLFPGRGGEGRGSWGYVEKKENLFAIQSRKHLGEDVYGVDTNESFDWEDVCKERQATLISDPCRSTNGLGNANHGRSPGTL